MTPSANHPFSRLSTPSGGSTCSSTMRATRCQLDRGYELATFRAQIETNLFGVIIVTKAAIPLMREKGRAHHPVLLHRRLVGAVGRAPIPPQVARLERLHRLRTRRRLQKFASCQTSVTGVSERSPTSASCSERRPLGPGELPLHEHLRQPNCFRRSARTICSRSACPAHCPR